MRRDQQRTRWGGHRKDAALKSFCSHGLQCVKVLHSAAGSWSADCPLEDRMPVITEPHALVQSLTPRLVGRSTGLDVSRSRGLAVSRCGALCSNYSRVSPLSVLPNPRLSSMCPFFFKTHHRPSPPCPVLVLFWIKIAVLFSFLLAVQLSGWSP